MIRENKVLKKLCLVNVDGDSGGFLALGAALNTNTTDNIQACIPIYLFILTRVDYGLQ